MESQAWVTWDGEGNKRAPKLAGRALEAMPARERLQAEGRPVSPRISQGLQWQHKVPGEQGPSAWAAPTDGP